MSTTLSMTTQLVVQLWAQVVLTNKEELYVSFV